MIDVSKLHYTIAKDLDFLLGEEGVSIDELSEEISIPRALCSKIVSGETIPSEEVCEKIYSRIYRAGYRLNSTKEEFLREANKGIPLFHGSKRGLEIISEGGSRSDCDFSRGFYLGENYENALSFVYDVPGSSVYSFFLNMEELKIKRFEVSLEWMLAICHFRGTLGEYDGSPLIRKIAREVEAVDLVVAPIADNKMFFIMNQFAFGQINKDVALHSLSASKLGMQYVLRTEKALDRLVPVEKYYLCAEERRARDQFLIERSMEIDTKLKLAMREFKNGLFIDEVLV